MSLNSQRQIAAALFAQHGLPTIRNEHWKYTDVSLIASLLDNPNNASVSSDLQPVGLPIDTYCAVFLDGKFDAAASSLPQGIDVLPLSALMEKADQHTFLANLFSVSGDEPLFNGLLALNAAKAEEGLAILVSANTKLDKPLLIQHINHHNTTLRHGIVLGNSAQAEIIEHYIGSSDTAAFTNVATHIILNVGASLGHYRLQQEGLKHTHIGRVDVHQHQDSHYNLHAVELGASLSRADIVVNLAEQGASCDLNGLFVLDGRQHVDHHTRIDHTAPYCTSKENYRNVLDGRSHGVFNGKVVVHVGAIKTDSAQSSGNLLLSKNASIDTKPELEIYNDDVKCAHGATVGQLDDKQLFYLQSRGISREEAQELLTFAFADEVLASMANRDVRSYVEKAAFAKLPHGVALEELLS